MITNQELGKGLLTLKIIWFAMLVSVFIYLFVGLYAGTNFPSMEQDEFAILRPILYVLALIDLIATKYVRKFVLLGKGQHQRPGQTSHHPALRKYYTATIVALGLSECIGVYGLVLFFLGKNTMDLYLLILISAGAMMMYRPRTDEVIGLSQTIRGGLNH